MPPRRDEPRRITSELIAAHTRRGRALQRAAIYQAVRALLALIRSVFERLS